MNEHDCTCCLLRASTTAPLKETSAKQAGIVFCFMRIKGAFVSSIHFRLVIVVLKSGSKQRIVLRAGRLPTSSSCFNEECIEMMGSF